MSDSQQFAIKDTCVYDDTLVLVAGDNTVWVMGDNKGYRLGVKTEKLSRPRYGMTAFDSEWKMKVPVKTSIQLHDGETVSKVYQHGLCFMIHTSQKRMFISRVLKPSLCTPSPTPRQALEADLEGFYPVVGEPRPTLSDRVPIRHSSQSRSRYESATEIETDSDSESDSSTGSGSDSESSVDSIYELAWPDTTDQCFVMPYSNHSHTPSEREEFEDTDSSDLDQFRTRSCSPVRHRRYPSEDELDSLSCLSQENFLQSSPLSSPLSSLLSSPLSSPPISRRGLSQVPMFSQSPMIRDDAYYRRLPLRMPDPDALRTMLGSYNRWISGVSHGPESEHAHFDDVQEIGGITYHEPRVLLAIYLLDGMEGLMRTREFVIDLYTQSSDESESSHEGGPTSHPAHPYATLIEMLRDEGEQEQDESEIESDTDTEPMSEIDYHDSDNESDRELYSALRSRVSRPIAERISNSVRAIDRARTRRSNRAQARRLASSASTDQFMEDLARGMSRGSQARMISTPRVTAARVIGPRRNARSRAMAEFEQSQARYGNVYGIPPLIIDGQVVASFVSEGMPASRVRAQAPRVSTPAPWSLSQPRAHPSESYARDCGLRHRALPSTTGHDFGVVDALTDGSNRHSDRRRINQFSASITNLRSVHYASEPGFHEPLLDIDEVTCTEGTIFFRRGNNHYVYDWRLTAGSALWGNLGIALIPTQHAQVLTYYQLDIPFTPTVTLYSTDYLYMRNNSRHHVFTSRCCDTSEDDTSTKTQLSWIYFKMHGLTPDHIHVSGNRSTINVHHKGALYQYIHILKKLVKVTSCNLFSSMVRGGSGTTCDDPDGPLLFAPSARDDKLVIYGGTSWDACIRDLVPHIIDIHRCGVFYSDTIVLIDHPDHEVHKRFDARAHVIIFNTDTVVEYVLTGCGIAFTDRDGEAYFCICFRPEDTDLSLIETIQVRPDEDDDSQYYVCRWDNKPCPGPVTSLQSHTNAIVFKGGNGSWHTCRLETDELSPYTTLAIGCVPKTKSVTRVNPKLISRPKPGGIRVPISIQTCADRLERLSTMAELFNIETRFAISFDRKSRAVSYGEGPKLVFTQDALSQFASTYLTQHQALPTFNLEAFTGMAAPKLYAYGRMLHMAMTITESNLSIRLPLALLAAIKDRKPTIEELEFVAEKENPQVYSTVKPYRDDAAGLLDCGYTSYQECLETLVHYVTDEHTPKIKAISRTIAEGLQSYAGIANLSKMNIPTLDYYMSGDYQINRNLLGSLLDFKSSAQFAVSFIRNLIASLPEEKLAVLLRNWTGTTVVINKPYYVESGRDLMFKTCSMTLTVPSKLMTDQPGSPFTPETLTELLTTPVDYIRD